MAIASPLIEVRGAAFRYGGHTVFSAVDFDIFRGEVLTVLGPNGCGKSTLLRCIGGALSLAQGTARIDGVDVCSLDAGARARKLAFLFQRHMPSFPFPVLDVVTMGRTPHLSLFGAPSSVDRALAEEALAKVGMLHLKNRPYTALSGGELQLVLLARTLVQQPDVILLDEPTSHLDFKNQTVSLKTIGALAKEGVTMVMTTHDPNHAFLLPGRVLLMKPGGPILTGPASEIITDTTLTATYGLDITVFSTLRRNGSGELRYCSPW
ncbi:MAG TPA: ABC transporter ATP-binding protein [Steroidobacteraceae bacterium]|nr:ABC transporter ATP-binding protein [Steroidobacteraceae bacterium]